MNIFDAPCSSELNKSQLRELSVRVLCKVIKGRFMIRILVFVSTVLLHGAVSRNVLAENPIRVATFNCSLNRESSGKLVGDLKGGRNVQAQKVARILRTVRPQIVLLNEFDFDPEKEAVRIFMTEYLAAEGDWATEPPISYSDFYVAPVNTGVPSGRDFDHDGKKDGPADAIGFGKFPGQYGMVVLSQFPIDMKSVRTFQNLLWKSMPDALLPSGADPATPMWYDEQDLDMLRISSKSHWDVPVMINGQTLHILASHPTPPAFDGPEDRNGRRNRDEIRLWAEYLSEGPTAWLVDDSGVAGSLSADSSFVILGDQNADPNDGGSFPKTIQQLLEHPRVNSEIVPTSTGGAAASKSQMGANLQHRGDPSHDTADFSDKVVGNLRADYALPSRNLQAVAAGVFWPSPGEPGAELVTCSDHRLVWVEVNMSDGLASPK